MESLELWKHPSYIEGDDCYDIIGFASPYRIMGKSTNPITGEGHISMTQYFTLFLHSDLGLQGDAIGPDSSQSTLRKIVPGSQVNNNKELSLIAVQFGVGTAHPD